LIIAIFFGFCGTYAALNGQPVFGGIIAGTTLVSLVGVFVYSKQQALKELSDKRRAATTPPAKPPSALPKEISKIPRNGKPRSSTLKRTITEKKRL